MEGNKLENNVSVKVKHSDEMISYLLKNKRLVTVFILAIGFMCLYKLASQQAFLDHCVEFSLYPAINKVFDGFVREGEVTWLWTPMYQHAVGRSPVYTGIMELGMRIFGLNAFGIRINIAIIFLLAYILVFYTLKKYFSNTMAVLTVLLTLSSPWGLVLLRSGGAVALGTILVTISVCLWALMYLPGEKQPKNRIIRNIIPIGAGIFTALLPYAHAGTRMFPIFIVLLTLLFIKKLDRRRALQFFIPLVLIMGIQLFDINNALNIYLSARGEGLFDMAKAESPDNIWAFIWPKLWENILILFKLLLGLNQDGKFFNINIADSYWDAKVVLFPKFLVPFFWTGIVLHLVNMFRKKKPILFIPIFLMGVAFIPALMSGKGAPNLARLAVSLPFIYYFIAHTFYQLFRLVDVIWDKMGIKAGVAFATFVTCLVLATMGYQLHNYYSFEKGGRDDKGLLDPFAIEQCFELWEQNEDAVIVYEDYAVFNVHSYGNFRFLGGKPLQEKIEEGKMILVQDEKIEEINNIINEGKVDLFITVQDAQTQKLFPKILEYTRTDIVPNECIEYRRP